LPPTEALARLRAQAVATGQTASEVARAIMDRRLVLDRDGSGHGDGLDDETRWRP